MTTGLIFDIKEFAINDGPGISRYALCPAGLVRGRRG